MSGFLGTGQSKLEQQTDNSLKSIFNYGMSQGQTGQAQGSTNLTDASAYFQKQLLVAHSYGFECCPCGECRYGSGRHHPRREEANEGTSRGGGTASQNREASSTTTKNIDDIINSNLIGGQEKAAAGLTTIGGQQQSNASNLLGLGENAENDVLPSAQNQTTREATAGQFTSSTAAKGILAYFGL